MEKHSKHILTPEEQSNFADWDWVAPDQELPTEPLPGKGKKKYAPPPWRVFSTHRSLLSLFLGERSRCDLRTRSDISNEPNSNA